ncbi:unnamed protein product [Taenia asiatica]|uniref:Ovule protein n=1 Tax=Taenia asiatica TaxID=60517 RepID=A0A0R3WAW2_TAEAS|nr:unnamed protein product [Taenia asiatica]
MIGQCILHPPCPSFSEVVLRTTVPSMQANHVKPRNCTDNFYRQQTTGGQTHNETVSVDPNSLIILKKQEII